MKKAGLYFISFFCIGALSAQTAYFSWAKRTGAASFDYGFSVCHDNSGNVYVTGQFSGTVDFDPGSGTYNLTSGTGSDVFIQKLSRTGNFIWARQITGTGGNKTGRAITIDNAGNILVVGSFSGSADFDPGSGTANVTATGNEDFFILKLSQAGNYVWHKKIGGNGYEYATSVATDANNNIFIGGYFNINLDFDPGAGTDIHSATGVTDDSFITKLDVSGNYVWTKQFAGTGDEFLNGLDIDPSGNVIATGYFNGTVDFDPGPGTSNLTGGNNDAFLFKIDNGGNLIWAYKIGSSSQDAGFGVTTDNNGNVFFTGYVQGTVDLDPTTGVNSGTGPGGFDIYIIKLNASGNYQWAVRMGGPGNDNGYSLATDAAGNVITTGYFNGTVDFEPGTGTTNLTSFGFTDVFIQKLDFNGNFLWAKQIGGTMDDIARGISLNNWGNPVLTGYFRGTADFDPGPGTYNLTTSGTQQYEDIFVAKLCSPTTSTITAAACYSYNSPSGNYTWTTSGTYADTLTNTESCDSIITINLTINSATSGSISPASCFSYMSPSGQYTWTTSGTYMDTLSNVYGCDSVLTINLTIKTVDTSITLNSGTFTVGQSGGIYQWGNCTTQSAISGAIYQSFTPTANGSYAVIVSYNGCTDTSYCHTITNVGITEEDIFQTQVYPNPVNDELSIVTGEPTGSTSYRIYDARGRWIIGENLQPGKNSISTDEFSPGIYTLIIENGDEQQFIKIVKE